MMTISWFRDTYLKLVGVIRKLIPVGRKEYNGNVERSHRTDGEELYRPHEFTDVQQRGVEARKSLDYRNNHRTHPAFGYLTHFQELQEILNSQGVAQV